MQSRLGIPLLAAVFTGALLGGLLGDRVRDIPSLGGNTGRLLKSFEEAQSTVEQNYAKPIAASDLAEQAIRGLLRTLDPHSSFFSRSDYSKLQEEQEGRYYGLGILIRPADREGGRVVIVEPPAPDTPGHKAGLRVGDVISRIEGESIDSWDYPDEIVPRLKGPKGTKANISVQRRGGGRPIELSVERDEIPLRTIKYAFHVQPQVGYIRINRFSETTGDELNLAMTELGEGDLQGLVLDLRDNPGGALRQAIEVADRFLEKGQLIVRTRGRRGRGREYRAPSGRKRYYRMALLINGNSASASEIVAGALQDHGRAVLVGQSSFGKALVQTIYPLAGRQGLALTTGRYYTPSNRLIQRQYSESLYDYYNSRGGAYGSSYGGGQDPDAQASGGITPDHNIAPRQPTRLGRLIADQNYFYEFSSGLLEDPSSQALFSRYFPQQTGGLTFGDKDRLFGRVFAAAGVAERFKGFLRGKRVAFTDRSFREIGDLVRSRLKQEIFLTLFGDIDSFRASLETDEQVQRALQLLPADNVLPSD